ncbi:MAG: chemotaxis protein CheB [Gammaproteobacteria bacterium]|nr:chemotaxis protein CheB [Gammaproteobacteria bacterium]
MADAMPRALRVALIAEQATQGKNLKELLEAGGLHVILEQAIGDYDPQAVGTETVDVLLVNLDESTSQEMDRLEALIEFSSVPILFNEGGVPGGGGWGRKLIAKLASLAQAHQPHPAQTTQRGAQPVEVAASETTGKTRPALRVVTPGSDPTAPAQMVWVLGASLGGPQALKQFLSKLPDTLPIGFVIAQHIGKPFVPLLAEQLGRVTPLRVMPAEEGRTVRAREVILVPIDRRFALTEAGVVELRDEPTRGPYKPCIDEVMEEVARCYGRNAGTIVFSGMGEDGALGAVTISAAGGQVWAQDAASCVIGSMPDATRRRGVVEFSGTPEELALRMEARFGVQAGAS